MAKEYDEEIRKLFGDYRRAKSRMTFLERNEMFNRSPGQGMFARLQRYKEMNRRIPFKIINTDLLTAGRVKPKTISQTKRIILGRIKA